MTWILYAMLSAVFASLVAIFGKIGVSVLVVLEGVGAAIANPLVIGADHFATLRNQRPGLAHQMRSANWSKTARI